MKAMKKDLQSVVKGLKTLLKKTERIERKLDQVPVTKARKGRPSIAAKTKPGRGGEGMAMVAVYNIIQKSRKGATTTQIRDKTGFDNKKIWNAINRLKTQKKIKSARRGVYVSIG
jgi:transcription initiation factor TFIIIB Brf1 subunit/transcription initiation factor TFIIB